MATDSYGEHRFSFREGIGALFVMLFFPIVFTVISGWVGYALWGDYSARPKSHEWWPIVVAAGLCLASTALCVWIYKGRKRSVEVYTKGVRITHREKNSFYSFEQMSELTSGVFEVGGANKRKPNRCVSCEAIMVDHKKVRFLRGNHVGVLDPDLEKLLTTLRETYDQFTANKAG